MILPRLGIDVILGMNWMKNHGVLIDTSTRTVMLRDPKNNEVLIRLPVLVRIECELAFAD